MRILTIFLMLVLLISCSEDEASGQEESTTNYTPKEVVRKYQDHIDKNEFDAAKALSTKSEQERLTAIAEIIAGEPADSTVFTTNFLQIECEQMEQKAICACLVEDFEERYRDTFILLLQGGKWLVDAPEEEINYDYNEEVEEYLEEELNKENE